MYVITHIVEAIVVIGLLYLAYRFVKSDMERKTGSNDRLKGRREL